MRVAKATRSALVGGLCLDFLGGGVFDIGRHTIGIVTLKLAEELSHNKLQTDNGIANGGEHRAKQRVVTVGADDHDLFGFGFVGEGILRALIEHT